MRSKPVTDEKVAAAAGHAEGEKPGKHPGGRPTDYDNEVAEVICSRLAIGESLRTICSEDGLPDKSTVFRWLAAHPEFRDQYASARATQADALFDEILDIADDGSNDWMQRKNADGENIGWTENGEALRRSALRVDARKWIVSKLLPKKYGDKQQVELSGEVKQTFDASALGKLTEAELEHLRALTSKMVDGEE